MWVPKKRVEIDGVTSAKHFHCRCRKKPPENGGHKRQEERFLEPKVEVRKHERSRAQVGRSKTEGAYPQAVAVESKATENVGRAIPYGTPSNQKIPHSKLQRKKT